MISRVYFVDILFCNREEKSQCHVAMVAKFLDDNKLIKSIRTISNYTDLIQFHLIWQIMAKFSLGPYRYLRLEKESDNFCAELLCC